MSKKESYAKYQKLAQKLINKYGTELTVVCGLDLNDTDEPYLIDDTKEVSYVSTGVIMPPVRGIYFQGTRFGIHSTIEDGLMDDKMSCFLLPVYDENKQIVDLSRATHIIGKTVDGTAEQRYKVYFCDVMKPAEKIIMYSYGLGR